MPTSPLYTRSYDVWEDDPPNETTPILAEKMQNIDDGVWGAYYNTIHQAATAGDNAAVFRAAAAQADDIVQFRDSDDNVLASFSNVGGLDAPSLIGRSTEEIQPEVGTQPPIPAGSVDFSLDDHGNLIVGPGLWNGTIEGSAGGIIPSGLAWSALHQALFVANALQISAIGDPPELDILAPGGTYPTGPPSQTLAGASLGTVRFSAWANDGSPAQGSAAVAARLMESATQVAHGGRLEFHTAPIGGATPITRRVSVEADGSLSFGIADDVYIHRKARQVLRLSDVADTSDKRSGLQSPYGVAILSKAGVIGDGDFPTDMLISGLIGGVDTVNNRLYVLVGTTWRYATLT